MMKIMLMMNLMMMMFMSIMCIFINLIPSHNKNIHPIMMSLILLILSVITSMNLSIYMSSHWFSFIMFLILIGGMMILFLYFTSFISNMKMSMKWMFINTIPIKMLIFMIMLIFMMSQFKNNFNWYNSYSEIYSNYKLYKFNYFNNNQIYTYMYMHNKYFNMIMSMLYLMLCLTLIVKICINKKLSIRKMLYEKINI